MRTIQCTQSLLHTTANSSHNGQKSPKESGSDIKRHTYTTLALQISCTSSRIDLAVSQSRSVVSKCASDRVVPTELGLHMQHVQNTGDCYIKTLLLGADHEIEVGVVLFADGMMAEAEEKHWVTNRCWVMQWAKWYTWRWAWVSGYLVAMIPLVRWEGAQTKPTGVEWCNGGMVYLKWVKRNGTKIIRQKKREIQKWL